MDARLAILLVVYFVAFAAVRPIFAEDVKATLTFPRLKHAREDEVVEFAGLIPRLKRWEKLNGTIEHDPVNMEEHVVKVTDARDKPELSVLTSGFEKVDLHPRLFPYLRHIHKYGIEKSRSGPTTAGSWLVILGGGNDETVEDKLAHALQGSDSFTLSQGEAYHYAFRCAGFVIRKGGPMAAKLNGTGFDNVAMRVHIDQDLQGEPLFSMGLTWVFRLPYMHLFNVWSPLTSDVRMRPLAFADKRTVNRAEDVLRYRTNSTANAGGKFGSFRSDRLMSVYSPSHEWYWYPNVRFGQAVAFDTSAVPHSSFSLEGEGLLALIRQDIEDFSNAKEAGQRKSICERNGNILKEMGNLSLDMDAMLATSLAFKKRICEGRHSESDIPEMLEYLSRASLEIRCVTFIAPKQVVHRAVGGLLMLSLVLLMLFIRKCSRVSSASVKSHTKQE